MKHLKCCVFVFCVLVLHFSIPWCGASTDGNGSVLLAEAENELTAAYDAVLGAERAGANVSLLLDQLNLAGDDLSQAYVWDSLGNSESAVHFSNLCYQIASNVKDEAIEVTKILEDQRNSELISIQLGSVTAIVVILVLSFVIWRVFKRRYCKRILRLKPEVDSN